MDWKVRLIFAILALTLINAYVNPGRKQQSQKDLKIKSCAEMRDNAFEKCANEIWAKWGIK